MKETLASYRYARALNEFVEDDQKIESVLESLRTLLELIETDESVHTTLKNPAITRDDRQQVLQALIEKLSLTAEASSFVVLLFKRHRLELLAYIVDQFSNMVDTRLKRITAEVQTTHPLSENEIERVKESLEIYSNKSVTMNIHEAPELLGGIVARMGNTVIDGSLQTRLKRLKEALLAEEMM